MLLEQDQNALGKKLEGQGDLTPEQLHKAVESAGKKGVSLPRYLHQAGILSKTKVYETLADIYGVPYVDVSNFQIAQDAIHMVPRDLAHRYKAMPLFKIGNTLNVAMENPTDILGIDHLAKRSRCSIDVCLGAETDIEAALNEHYGAASSVAELLETLGKERVSRSHLETKKVKPLPKPGMAAKQTAENPVVQLVNLLISQAFEEGASDIHIEPEEKLLRIRYRVDGVLHEASTPSKELESEIISRIKILAEMDIAETRLPQDGRIKMTIHEKIVDMRVSSMPTVYGENIVIRILKDSNQVLDLPSLGMVDSMQKMFDELIHRPYGMILETGPTGSGKTTTLYAALNLINSVERNIVTIEDPVEYKLPLIRQIPVNLKAGLTFANALRSILRQDPDVIMVGEMRDRETAEIAIQSALTGHLVFSTLHANSAAAVISRLIDMGIEPFLVSSSVIGIVSQRLVRKICDKCKTTAKPPKLLLEALQVKNADDLKIFKGKGCRQCHQTGYKGRLGIFELVVINDALQKLIMARASASEISAEARRSGMKSLRDDALAKIQKGLTTLDEVAKAVELG